MDKKRIHVEHFGPNDRPFRKEEHRRDRDHRHRRMHPRHPFGKMTTKLITSKEELVDYVNDLGAKGHHIDVFKIDDGLYKVVVVEGPPDLDIDVEIDED